LKRSLVQSFVNSPKFSYLTAAWRLGLAVTLLALLVVAGCGRGSQNAREINLAPLSAMPDFVQSAPSSVQEAYRFAVANPDLLRQMPCYCGCGSVGHTSNIDCYVKAFKPDGSVAEFENHAAL
jgi:hypothetical protein